MTSSEICDLLSLQRKFFLSGKTNSIQTRKNVLKLLYASIKKNEDSICQALSSDLGKSPFEAYMCEIGMVLSEIRYMVDHLHSFAKPRNRRTPIIHFPSRSFTKPEPYGTVLIISPWNYPFLLSIEPLVDAVAAGNTVMLKPSSCAPATSKVIADIIGKCFTPEYVTLITGGRDDNSNLASHDFDYIFFTGSQTAGKEIMRRAAANLTPVTLELGGKSPCIVDKTADIKLAARRIVFGKFLNCGQTCVAPDYIYCHSSIKKSLIKNIILEINRQFGQKPLSNTNYGKIINQRHYERITNLINYNKVVFGGHCEPETHRIEPTILDNVNWHDAVMNEEIFGPLLPILSFEEPEQVIHTINEHPTPLAMYVFGKTSVAKKFLSSCQFGGGCINDTIIHLATSHMGFGGLGESGMGAYHGIAGFNAFSHSKSIVNKKTWLDLSMRYQPYSDKSLKLLRRVYK